MNALDRERRKVRRRMTGRGMFQFVFYKGKYYRIPSRWGRSIKAGVDYVRVQLNNIAVMFSLLSKSLKDVPREEE